jgi:hypothetical protein
VGRTVLAQFQRIKSMRIKLLLSGADLGIVGPGGSEYD